MAQTLAILGELLCRIEDAAMVIWDAGAAIHEAVTDRRREWRGWDANMM